MRELFLVIFFLYGFSMQAQIKEFELQSGDLIFQEDCSGNTDNTIKAVTNSLENYQFTHVGIVYVDDNDSIYVLEAIHPVVSKTPLESYLFPKDKNCVPKSVVGRLKEIYRPIIPDALLLGLNLMGKAYDDGFILGNDKYYCSEFVYEILLKANCNQPVFLLNEMTFKSPDTGEITEGWKRYFARFNLPIPEGEPGINPGAMSRSDAIDIVHIY